MANENEPTSLEIEKLKLERFKVWGKIITVTITVLIGGALVAYINCSFQMRQIEQQKLLRDAELQLQQKKEDAELKIQNAKADADRRQAEMKYLGDFITYALADDHEKRLRFAEYFATLTISHGLRNKWKDYRNGIIKTMDELKAKTIELATAQKQGGKDGDRVRIIEAEIVQLNARLSALPEKSDVYLSSQKAEKSLLDKDWKPKNYTKNEFEVQKDSKVIYDKATKLMWQQSGSEMVKYDEAHNYIRQLNLEGFAGCFDWRLPTLKEAITLLKPEESNNKLFIDHKFDNKQASIWTSELSYFMCAWVVDFDQGYCVRGGVDSRHSVRAVR